MAELVVGSVVGKLTNIIEKEMEVLGGVGMKLQRVHRELIRINCCLRDADMKRRGDERVNNWLNELRDLVFHIEDILDMFFLKVEVHRRKDPRFLQKLKKSCLKLLKVDIFHKFSTELDNIQNELGEICRIRVIYGITDLPDVDRQEVIMPLRRAAFQVDETEVVGMQADKNNILKLLRPEETLSRAVITIVGMGGLGKTTLANMVYRSARAEFKYHIALSISQHFSLTDLLRKMLHQLKDSVHDQNQDVEDLISELKKILSSRRYLIILDDVWQINLWNDLKDALPDVKNGSRVLMTSRFIDVAESADSKMAPYELKFLDDKKSLDLLLKKALPYQEPGKECPRDLVELADELSKKCKGLPLALIVIGGRILSTKERVHSAWKRVLQTLDWHSDGKYCMGVLAMSYHDMPYYFKACFLYLASFPEDYEISAKRLIRMWVAEGFIQHEEWQPMEKMGEVYLEELFKRSMIQVSSQCMNGSIKCFQVHVLHRELAMHEAKQQNFFTVVSQESDVNQPNRGIRRASLQSCSPQFMEYVDSNVRSLLWFGLHFPNCSTFRLLKVLELVGVTSNTLDLVKGLEDFYHLKYLGFRNCEISFSPRSFQIMKTLETLDVRGTRAELPDDLWTIGTLRHVLCDFGLIGPKSTTYLRNLQTMRWVRPSRTWDRELPYLNNLCKLGISWVDDWVAMTNLFQTLPSLVSLGIKGSLNKRISLPTEIVYPKSLPHYENLQSLHLQGKWSSDVTLEASSFPQHLIKLTLVDSQLGQNPMPELGKLKSLKKLCLRYHVTNYIRPITCPNGFPVLHCLEVVGSNMKDLTVAQGVMPKLKYLQLKTPINFKFHLPSVLEHVTVQYFGSTLEGKDQICKQFPLASFN